MSHRAGRAIFVALALFLLSVFTAGTSWALSSTPQVVHDKAGRLRFWIDANGAAANPNRIGYRKYDGIGRLTEEGYVERAFDRNALQTQAEDASEPPSPAQTWRKRYIYEAAGEDGRLSAVQWNNGSGSSTPGDEAAPDSLVMTYDVRGRLANTVETIRPYQIGMSTTYKYDDAKRAMEITYPFPVGQGAPDMQALSVRYAYDNLGRIIKIGRVLNGKLIDDYYATYAYGFNGELLHQTLNPSTGAKKRISVDYRYSSPGMLEGISAVKNGSELYRQTLQYSGATRSVSMYDDRISRMEQTYNLANSGAQTLKHGFTYFREGGIKSAEASGTLRWGSLTASDFSYHLDEKDADGDLFTVRQGGHAGPFVYTYAPGTNRVDNIAEAGQPSIAYTHDANGNVTSKSGHLKRVDYDPFYNMATRVQHARSAPSESYEVRYGGVGNERVWQRYRNNGRILENVYYSGGGLQPLAIFSSAGAGGGSPVLARKVMVYGPAGLVAVNEFDGATGTSTDHFVVSNHNGSTVAVYDKNGSLEAGYAYTPTGNIYKVDNGELVASPQVVPYLFQGQEYDWQTALHNYRARFYDSKVARFMAPDPVFRSDQSPYVAMNNDPVNYDDPDGRNARVARVRLLSQLSMMAGAALFVFTPELYIPAAVFAGLGWTVAAGIPFFYDIFSNRWRGLKYTGMLAFIQSYRQYFFETITPDDGGPPREVTAMDRVYFGLQTGISDIVTLSGATGTGFDKWRVLAHQGFWSAMWINLGQTALEMNVNNAGFIMGAAASRIGGVSTLPSMIELSKSFEGKTKRQILEVMAKNSGAMMVGNTFIVGCLALTGKPGACGLVWLLSRATYRSTLAFYEAGLPPKGSNSTQFNFHRASQKVFAGAGALPFDSFLFYAHIGGIRQPLTELLRAYGAPLPGVPDLEEVWEDEIEDAILGLPFNANDQKYQIHGLQPGDEKLHFHPNPLPQDFGD